jgi:hypothetical protein
MLLLFCLEKPLGLKGKRKKKKGLIQRKNFFSTIFGHLATKYFQCASLDNRFQRQVAKILQAGLEDFCIFLSQL